MKSYLALFYKRLSKNYAELLNLNPSEIVGLYEKTASQNTNGSNSKASSYKLKPRNRIFVISSVILFIILFVALWIYDNIYGEASTTDFSDTVLLGENQRNQPKAPLDSGKFPPTGNQVSVSQNNSVFAELGRRNASDSDSNKVINFNSLGPDTLDILFSDESWIEITDVSVGKRFREIMVTGDFLRVKGQAPFTVLVADALLPLGFGLMVREIPITDSIRIDNSASVTADVTYMSSSSFISRRKTRKSW